MRGRSAAEATTVGGVRQLSRGAAGGNMAAVRGAAHRDLGQETVHYESL